MKAHVSFTLRISEPTICPPAAARLLAIPDEEGQRGIPI